MGYSYQAELNKLAPAIREFVEKNNQLQDLIKEQKLDAEEITMEVETEKGERQPLPTKEFLFWSDVARVAAESTLKKLNKKRQLTIRINEKDLMLLKVKSSELGMPYQTLLQSIIHQHVTKKE